MKITQKECNLEINIYNDTIKSNHRKKTFLKQEGFSDFKIIQLYKFCDYIMNREQEIEVTRKKQKKWATIFYL